MNRTKIIELKSFNCDMLCLHVTNFDDFMFYHEDGATIIYKLLNEDVYIILADECFILYDGELDYSKITEVKDE